MTLMLLGRIIITIATILHFILYTFGIVVFAAIIISWLRPDPSNPTIYNLIRIINNITEPVFTQVRKRLPAALYRTGLDFSPMVVGLFIFLADSLIVGTLLDIGYRLRLGAF